MTKGKVYINGREVVQQGSQGSSTAFPDVCWVPDGSGRKPAPLSNTVRAADLQNCAATVYVNGNPVALEDSYFQTSYGSEISKPVGGGVVSRASSGSAYFASFSSNVFIEGKAVPRHGDAVTHNHTGVVANAQGVWLSSTATSPSQHNTPPLLDPATSSGDEPNYITGVVFEPDLYTGELVEFPSSQDEHARHTLSFGEEEHKQPARMMTRAIHTTKQDGRLHIDAFANPESPHASSTSLDSMLSEMTAYLRAQNECLNTTRDNEPDTDDDHDGQGDSQ